MEQTLYLVRHGQTEFNVRGLAQGWCDSPLTELGKEQALKVHKYFSEKNITFDHAYSSSSERACDTMELITDMPYERMKGLKEWRFGTFEGMPIKGMNVRLPFGNYFKENHGGESEDEFHTRIRNAFEKIMNVPDSYNVLAVSHGCVCYEFARWGAEIKKVTVGDMVPNCCILRFTYKKDANEFTLEEISVADL